MRGTEWAQDPEYRFPRAVRRGSGGGAILVIGVASLIVAALDAQAVDITDHYMLDLVLNWIVPIVVIAAMIGFTHTHPDRVRGGLDSGETAGAPPMDDASA